MAGAAHDLLERHAVRPQLQDGCVGLLAAQIALVLDLLGGGEQRGIDGHSAHGAADLPHRRTHGIKKGTAGILHQMPAVGDLGCLRQGRGCGKSIPTATITSHDGDLRLIRKPSSRRRGLTVGEQGDGPVPLQIADDGPVALVPAPRPVIDAHDRRRNEVRATTSPQDPQERILAEGQHQPLRQAARWAAAERDPEMMDELVQAAGPSRPRRQHVGSEALGEDAPPAVGRVAAKASRLQPEPNGPTRHRQVAQKPLIVAVDPPSGRAAARARARFRPMTHGQPHFRTVALGILYNKTGWDER